MIACGLMFGCLCAFIANAQQIFAELYGLGEAFALAFAAIALAMAAASITNARIVMRRGMRVVCHFALTGFVVLSVLLLVADAYLAPPPLVVFLPWLGLLFYLFGLCRPNLNAIALEPMGEIAGLGRLNSWIYDDDRSLHRGMADWQRLRRLAAAVRNRFRRAELGGARLCGAGRGSAGDVHEPHRATRVSIWRPLSQECCCRPDTRPQTSL